MTVIAALIAALGAMLVPTASPQFQETVQACEGTPDGLETDFNGDGHADAAIGDPFKEVGGVRAGAVTVMFGDGDGRVGEGERLLLTQNSVGMPDRAEEGDRFGFALESANLDGDGCTDLVVAAPGERVGGAERAGAVLVLYGTREGIGEQALWIDQRTPGVPGVPENDDQFGHRLSAAPARGPDDAVVVAGVPYEDAGSVRDAGGLVSLRFTKTREQAAARWFDQSTPGVPGVQEQADLFGSDVELAQVSGSQGRWDLIIGTPYEDIGAERNAGSMTRVEDIAEAVSEHRSRAWTQDSPGVAGHVEAGDLFGTDPEHVVTPEGGYLGVGVPGEDLSGASNGGMAQIFRESDGGLSPQRTFHQDLAGAAGGVEDDDFLGAVLHGVVRPVAGGHARLVVGLPNEDLSGHRDAGAVQSFSLDARAIEDRWISQDVTGVSGSADAGDRFGAALGTAGDQDEQALVVGVPQEDGRGVAHVLPFDGGGGRLWYPGDGGVPGGAARFGFSVA